MSLFTLSDSIFSWEMERVKRHRTDLKDGVHDTRQRPVKGVLGHSEDIQAPFVDVLQVLLQSRENNS